MEAGAAIPRAKKPTAAGAPPSLLSGMTPPPAPPVADSSAKSQANKGPHVQQQQHYQHGHPLHVQQHHQQRPPLAASEMVRPSAQMSHINPTLSNMMTQPPHPLTDTHKKTLRHLDTLTELVGRKIADQVERNKTMLSVNILDPGSREYKRLRDTQKQQGNVDLVSINLMFIMSSVVSILRLLRSEKSGRLVVCFVNAHISINDPIKKCRRLKR
eukprot:CAMPEP_0172555350 /NCGR_PEP_ID=MMETSP1067-20121228/58370_1 /TAXON_ID=265564 ORGANISM="Thalassiosira punctigera, Strain Tpunct2005C2" /NCGR_SAMPLE_ID=MMETSP1067 /ASSEMBLY_ACC=CAM_ASM_000444 /LENGTH=213 /DNA_ID=CAMNT_0013343865 /DNA_START=94 /DNA_END=732 /DNA_ORIENTATION=-